MGRTRRLWLTHSDPEGDKLRAGPGLQRRGPEIDKTKARPSPAHGHPIALGPTATARHTNKSSMSRTA